MGWKWGTGNVCGHNKLVYKFNDIMAKSFFGPALDCLPWEFFIFTPLYSATVASPIPRTETTSLRSDKWRCVWRCRILKKYWWTRTIIFFSLLVKKLRSRSKSSMRREMNKGLLRNLNFEYTLNLLVCFRTNSAYL